MNTQCFTIFMAISLVLLFTAGLYAQNTSSTVTTEGPLVNQRIVVLDFVNVQNNPDIEYLIDTLPSTLEIALVNTGNFHMLDRATARTYCQENGIPEENLFNDSVAGQVGIFLEADAVVIGSYMIMNEQLRVNIKAISPKDLQIYTALVKTGDAMDMFAVIDATVAEMADKMTQALPPVPARTIIRETEVVEVEKEVEVEVEVEKEAEPEVEEIKLYPLRPVAWVFWGVGAAGLGLGITFQAFSSGRYDEYQTLFAEYEQETVDVGRMNDLFDESRSRLDESKTFYALSWVGFGVAAAGAGLGVFFWLKKNKEAASKVTFWGSPRPEGAMGGFSLRF